MKLLLCLLVFFLPIASCNAQLHQTTFLDKPEVVEVDTTHVDTLATNLHHFHLPYHLSKPTLRFELPAILKEISGLSMASDSTTELLTAIQDEEGILFYINKQTGIVENEIPFYKPGDYEGVEVVGAKIFVVKSTGTIYEIRDLAQTPPYVEKHKFFLSKENDVEGLCYDAKENRLLIACKGMPITGESLEATKYKKAIYSFYLEDSRMDLVPTFVFTLENIQSFLEKCEATEDHEKLCGYFKPDVKNLIFSPSAIAIHPLTGNLYMTSSAKKILMVFDGEGKILHLEKMDKSIHPQPEGLTFDKDGTLYISNEGKQGPGTILRFPYTQEQTID